MKFLAIKGYWRHQHYHKRGAPWIKLYASVLVDPAFIQMPEAAQAQLMKLWVLASQFGHPLPNNQKLLAGKIGTTGKFYLASLIDAGFVIPCENEYEATIAAGEKNASKFLDENEQNATSPAHASAHSRESRELEGEVEKPLHQPTLADHRAESELGAMLASDADRNALTVVVSRALDRHACIVALQSMLTGNDPALTRTPSAGEFGQALRDMATNGAQPTARKIRNYIAEAMRGDDPATMQRRTGGVAQRTFNNGKRALEGM